MSEKRKWQERRFRLSPEWQALILRALAVYLSYLQPLEGPNEHRVWQEKRDAQEMAYTIGGEERQGGRRAYWRVTDATPEWCIEAAQKIYKTEPLPTSGMEPLKLKQQRDQKKDH